jgi:S1-C subfamily serine protease
VTSGTTAAGVRAGRLPGRPGRRGGPAARRRGHEPRGKPVRRAEDIPRLVDEAEPGDRVELEVLREGDRETVEAELGTAGR